MSMNSYRSTLGFLRPLVWTRQLDLSDWQQVYGEVSFMFNGQHTIKNNLQKDSRIPFDIVA